MRKISLITVALFVGLLAGFLLRPDDGTQVDISPAEGAAVVAGVDHAKPLPRVPTPSVDLVRDLIALSALVLLALLLGSRVPAVARPADARRTPALLLARVGARRGPPVRP